MHDGDSCKQISQLVSRVRLKAHIWLADARMMLVIFVLGVAFSVPVFACRVAPPVKEDDQRLVITKQDDSGLYKLTIADDSEHHSSLSRINASYRVYTHKREADSWVTVSSMWPERPIDLSLERHDQVQNSPKRESASGMFRIPMSEGIEKAVVTVRWAPFLIGCSPTSTKTVFTEKLAR